MSTRENIIISALSLNVDKKDAPNKAIPELFAQKPDYYVEFTQEDSRSIDNNPLIGTENLNGLEFLAKKSLNKGLTGITSQNVMIKLYASRSLPHLKFKKDGSAGEPETDRIPLAKSEGISGQFLKGAQALSGYTKGAVWIFLEYDYYSLLFVNLHLPIDTSKKNVNDYMGYKYRSESFRKILNELKPKIKKATFTLFG